MSPPAQAAPSMKTAVFPDGRHVNFPPETPDAHIDAHVRREMGLPPEEDPTAAAQQQTVAAMQSAQMASTEMTQSVVALHQQMGRIMQQMAAVNQTLLDAVQQMTTVADAIGRRTDTVAAGIAEKFEQSNDKVVEALTAKKSVTTPSGTFTVNVVK